MKSPTINYIPGGYYLKARCVADIDVAHAPPHVREIWDYLLRKALFKDGKHLKRGEASLSYAEIQTDLAWFIGWRKMQYSKSQCETAMKWLKKAGMITTRRTTHGFIINICNYNIYQDPKNYEGHDGSDRKTDGRLQTSDTTEKNDKEMKQKETLSGSDNHVYQILRECPKLMTITHEQYWKVRQEFSSLRSLEWADLAKHTVSKANLMAESIKNPALFWRRQIENQVSKKSPSPAGTLGETATDRLASTFIQ